MKSHKGFNVLFLDSAAGGEKETKEKCVGGLEYTQLAAHRTDSKATAMASRGVTGDAWLTASE